MTGDALDLDKLRAKAEGAIEASGGGWYEPGSSFITKAFWGGADGEHVITASPERILALLDAHAAAVREVEELRAVVARVEAVLTEGASYRLVDRVEAALDALGADQ